LALTFKRRAPATGTPRILIGKSTERVICLHIKIVCFDTPFFSVASTHKPVSNAITVFRCVLCAAAVPVRVTSCPSCFSSGTMLPAVLRPPAHLDSEPARATARELSSMAWRHVELRTIPGLIVGVGGLLLVAGPPGSGKSTLAARALDGVRGPVLLVSSEEGLGPTLAARLARVGVRRADFHVLAGGTVDGVVDELRRVRARACAVDSIQIGAWTAQDLRRLLAVVEGLDLLIAVSQVNKAGAHHGLNALAHEADVVLRVEALRWTATKSRYQPLPVEGGVLRTPDPQEATHVDHP
jgi:predicted ATP-dependent serine protease